MVGSLFSFGGGVRMETGKRCDMACAILRATNDGADLHPFELCLVQDAVNGFLSEKGEKVFLALHGQILSGTHKSPFKAWFHGIENMTIDPVGYVSWRGKRIEHYNSGWCWGTEAKAEAKRLAGACKLLESRGAVPSNSNIFRAIDEFFPERFHKKPIDGVLRVESISEIKDALRG